MAAVTVQLAPADVITAPPITPAIVNVNISKPVLTVVSNSAVASGGSMNLVWSDEFDNAQLDPAVWFFEEGDGSQYSLSGWGNNELQWYLPDSVELTGGMLVITAREESAEWQGLHLCTNQHARSIRVSLRSH